MFRLNLAGGIRRNNIIIRQRFSNWDTRASWNIWD